MRTSNQCPKCGSAAIVQLAGVTFNTKVYPYGHEDTGYSKVGRYACTDCGFVETYLTDPEELASLKNNIG